METERSLHHGHTAAELHTDHRGMRQYLQGRGQTVYLPVRAEPAASENEKELGISLFERDTHHLAVTEAGTIFLRYARETLNREKQMHAMISDVMDGNVGEIRVNLAMEQGIELFCEIFPEFHAKYPQVELKLEDHIVYDQYKFLAEGKLDIGMVMVKNHEMEDLEYVHLAEERFLLGVPADHPLTRFYQPTADGDYPEMDLTLCRQEPFSLMFAGSTFRQVIDPCFERAGFTPKIMFEARTNHVIALMVSVESA